jgi:hypothetical protein
MLAFSDNSNQMSLMYLDTILNLLFFIDIVLNFFSAFYDPDFEIIDDIKVSLTNNFRTFSYNINYRSSLVTTRGDGS